MKRHIFASVLKGEMTRFIKMRESQGFKDGHRFVLVSLDKYLVANNVAEKSLTAKNIDAWLADACKELSTRSVNVYIGYFNSFAKYLYILGIEVFTPEYVRIREAYIPYIFSEAEIEALFSAVDDINLRRQKKYIVSQIQFAMLLRLLYGCGLRLGEALGLKKSDVDIGNGVIFIRSAKGNCDRFVPMEPGLTSALRCYSDFLLSNKPKDAWVFESDKGQGENKPRALTWVWYPFRKALAKAGINLLELPPGERNICLHCLRHTFIVRSFRKQDLEGIDNYGQAASLSVYVGHVNLKGTQRYLHMTSENSIDIINATNEYSKGMFPSVPVELDSIIENEARTITKPSEIMINYCSTGMFPEVPR